MFRDLNLDRVLREIALLSPDHDIESFFRMALRDPDAITYRQDVMRDLEDASIMGMVKSFGKRMQVMRTCLDLAEKRHYPLEKQRWHLAAVESYVVAIEGLAADLQGHTLASRGMCAFRDYLVLYAQQTAFAALASATRKLVASLSAIRYCLLIRNGSVTVRDYRDETDYTTAIETTFAKFRRGDDHVVGQHSDRQQSLNHVEAQILDRVARLNPDTFQALAGFCDQHARFADGGVIRFDREIQFYIAYLGYAQKFRDAGLALCYPQLSTTSKAVSCRAGFDPALSRQLLDENKPVVCNDFELRGTERVLVVTGPNQGGKTTFARMFGQLHYLASLGCLVPAAEARLFLADCIFTHFERDENIENLRGKLQDDLVRIRHTLDLATTNSLIVMNESFSATSLQDSVLLSKRILERIFRLDMLGVCVTFLSELSALSEKVVSVVSIVKAKDPNIRTYLIERRPANHLAYALVLAEKYRVTYDAVKQRIA